MSESDDYLEQASTAESSPVAQLVAQVVLTLPVVAWWNNYIGFELAALLYLVFISVTLLQMHES